MFYIDKTDLICKWWESKDEITLITRPRRFGKTLNMSMLNCFFSNQFTGREDPFKGLAVWKKEKYRKMQGTYPVIFLSFAAIKGSNYERCPEMGLSWRSMKPIQNIGICLKVMNLRMVRGNALKS